MFCERPTWPILPRCLLQRTLSSWGRVSSHTACAASRHIELSHDKGIVRRRDRRETQRRRIRQESSFSPVQLFIQNGELNRHDWCCRGAIRRRRHITTALDLLTAPGCFFLKGCVHCCVRSASGTSNIPIPARDPRRTPSYTLSDLIV